MMELFYNSTLTATSESVQLEAEESIHLAKVLRKKEGDIICLTNGNGLEWKGVLSQVSTRGCIANKEETAWHPKPQIKLELAVAPTKNIQRMEWLLEKATEIGVTHFTPVLCQHAERKVIKPERLQKILIAAMKQSQQFFLPTLAPLTPFKQVLKSTAKAKYIAHCQSGKKTVLDKIDLPTHQQEAIILIGPEGDFAPEEVQWALEAQFQAVSLGQHRLRTETAGLMAAHSLLIKLNEQL